MIIAISTDKEDNWYQPVSENFGRSQWLCLYDTDTRMVRFIENIAGSTKQNAGIKTINFLLELNVDTVLSGRFGTITTVLLRASNPQPIGFSGILLAKRQNSFYCTYSLYNRNIADTKSPYPIKRLEVIRWFNQKSMVFNQSLS